MRIAFYLAEYGDWQDKLISFFTFSKYSHCELVFSDGTFGSASSRDGGVRLKYIEQNDHWDIYDIYDLDMTQEMEQVIRAWFVIHKDEKYDWPGAIMSLFGVNWTSDDKKFCSYVCAQLLGLDPIVTPQKLYENLIKEKMISV
jgi:hypothetical protein